MSKKELPMDRFLLEGQRTSVNIGFTDGSPAQEIFSTAEILLEAPNWHPHTDSLLLNGNGKLGHFQQAGDH